MADRAILWQKWVNPLTGRGGEDAAEEAEPDDWLSREAEQYRNPLAPEVFRPKIGPCIAGPMGIIPVNEHGDPAVVYDFWMLHANFVITHEVERVGSSVPGVEAWNTFSPYRARLAFGKAFTRSEVMSAVSDALGCGRRQPQPPPPDGLAVLRGHLARRHKHWAIFVLPDGQTEVARGDEQSVRDEVRRRPAGSYTRVVTSWDENGN